MNTEANKKKIPEWLFAGLLSIITGMIVFGIMDVLPWQDKLVFSGDAFEQIVPLTRMFFRKMFSGGDFLYSDEYIQGGNTSLAYSFYCSSFFNLPFLFIKNVEIAALLMFLLRLFAAASFFSLFGKKTLKAGGIWNVFISASYALCVFYFANINMPPLLEGHAYLPLILMLIDRMLKTGKKTLLTVVFAALFISQFYCGYVVSIAAVGFFICELIIRKKEKNGKEWAAAFGNLAISGVTAALISGILLIPAGYYALFMNAAEPPAPADLYPVFVPLGVFYPFLPGRILEFDTMIPFLFCGTASLFSCVLYFLDNSFRKTERVVTAVCLVILFASIYIPGLYYALHLFNLPNGYTIRFAFVIVFVVCAAALREVSAGKMVVKKTVITGTVMLLLYSCVWFVCRLEPYGMSELSVGIKGFALFAAVLIVFTLLFSFKPKSSRLFISVLVATVILENIYSGMMVTSYINLVDRQWFLSSDQKCNYNINKIKEYTNGDYGRIKYTDNFFVNNGPFYDYRTYGFFSSAYSDEYQKAMNDMGLASQLFATTTEGSSELLEQLMGVKFYVYPAAKDGGDNYSIVESEYALPLGYAVSADAEGIVLPEKSPFIAMNQFVSGFTGINMEPFSDEGQAMGLEWHDMDAYEYEEGYMFKINGPDPCVIISVPHIEDRISYIYPSFTTGYRDRVRAVNSNTDNRETRVFRLNKDVNYAVHGEQNGDRDIVYLKFDRLGDEELYLENSTCFAYFDPDALRKTHDILAPGGVNITDQRDGHIEGNVTVGSGQNMIFFSIPYEEGWNAWIDGEKAEVVKLVDGAFIGVRAGEGTHQIVLDYETPGEKEGIISFSLGMVILLLTWLLDRKKYKKI